MNEQENFWRWQSVINQKIEQFERTIKSQQQRIFALEEQVAQMNGDGK